MPPEHPLYEAYKAGLCNRFGGRLSKATRLLKEKGIAVRDDRKRAREQELVPGAQRAQPGPKPIKYRVRNEQGDKSVLDRGGEPEKEVEGGDTDAEGETDEEYS